MKLLADKIIELRIATRRACMCENTDNNKKSTLSLKTKILYLISKNCNPKEITLMLCIAKTNLALIAKSLIADGLIVRHRGLRDKREISYTLTAKGKKYLNSCLEIIESNFKNIFADEKEYAQAIEKIDQVLDTFSYVSI